MKDRSAIASGGDPIETRRLEQAEVRAAAMDLTFREAAKAVHDKLKAGFRNPKHAAQWINTLEEYVLPNIGDRKVSELRAADFAVGLRPIWLTKPEMASRVRQRCDAVMNWCAARDIIIASPVKVVTALLPAQPGKRERVEHHPTVPWRDLPSVCKALFRDASETTGRLLLEFVILTACRSGEARGMVWNEIDRDRGIWTIPAGRMKARAVYRVPLAPRAREILQRMKAQFDGSPFVFASGSGTALSDMTLTRILRDAGISSDTHGRTATVHGFRSSFRDWASENAYARDLAERALAHTMRNAAEVPIIA